jgi:DNA-binding MarR family transcriptional regulator
VTRTISRAQEGETEIADVLGTILKGERGRFIQACVERGVSMGQLVVLAALDERGPLTMSRIAEVIGSGMPTATGVITRMEERGLVAREHDTADRRVVRVRLTDAGASHLRELADIRRRRLSAALRSLEPEQREALRRALTALRSALERPSGATTI